MKMRFFKDDLGIETEVEWYYVPENRPVLPYFTPFRSGDWVLREEQPILGEVAGTRKYFAGNVADDLDGLGLCGSRDQWENGCSILDDIRPINPTTLQPCCCGPGSIPFTPAVVFDSGEELTLFPRSDCTLVDAPKWYRLQIIGASNESCTNCASLNGNWLLTARTGFPNWCSWISNPHSACPPAVRHWEMRFGGQWPIPIVADAAVDDPFAALVAYRPQNNIFRPWGFTLFLRSTPSPFGCFWPNAIGITALWEPF